MSSVAAMHNPVSCFFAVDSISPVKSDLSLVFMSFRFIVPRRSICGFYCVLHPCNVVYGLVFVHVPVNETHIDD